MASRRSSQNKALGWLLQRHHRHGIVVIWKRSLQRLLAFYKAQRGPFASFFPRLFGFFILLNVTCYWWAMLTAFPGTVFGRDHWHYFLIQFPVGCLGALFDSLSFFITVAIAKRALKTTSVRSYIAHLSIDVVIAVIATWWVLFVFSFSGWLVSWLQQQPESFVVRSYVYEQRLVNAVKAPTATHNLKNIYFGLIMGFSAILPTLTHLSLSAHAVWTYWRSPQPKR